MHTHSRMVFDIGYPSSTSIFRSSSDVGGKCMTSGLAKPRLWLVSPHWAEFCLTVRMTAGTGLQDLYETLTQYRRNGSTQQFDNHADWRNYSSSCNRENRPGIESYIINNAPWSRQHSTAACTTALTDTRLNIHLIREPAALSRASTDNMIAHGVVDAPHSCICLRVCTESCTRGNSSTFSFSYWLMLHFCIFITRQLMSLRRRLARAVGTRVFAKKKNSRTVYNSFWCHRVFVVWTHLAVATRSAAFETPRGRTIDAGMPSSRI